MAEDHEWVEAEVDLDNEGLAERTSVLLDRLGLSEEDKREPEAFVEDAPASEIGRLMGEEAQAIGGPAFDEVNDLVDWYAHMHEEEKTSKGGPLSLSRTVRRQVQRRLQKGRGQRKALLMILFFDCVARAYHQVTEDKR